MSIDIIVMQVFSGISLFTILVLMAVGLAIIFGLMGVINMAHGELMALGAYVTYLTAIVFEKYMPSLLGVYLFFAIAFAFLVTFALAGSWKGVLSASFITGRSTRCSRPGGSAWCFSRLIAQCSVRRK